MVNIVGTASVVRIGPLTLACTACGREFRSRSSATYHINLHTGHKPHICATCGKTFLDLRNMKKHEKRHVPLWKRPKCVGCRAQFLTERCLLRHIDGSFQHRRCTVCGAHHRPCAVPDGLSFGSHNSFTSAPMAAKKPILNSAAKDWQTSSRMTPRRTATVTSRGVRGRVSATGSRFSKSSNTKRPAALMHNGAGMHECPDCGKQLTSKGNLVRHYRLHTGERPFTCSDCGRTFADHGNMRKHARTHLGADRHSVPADSIELAELQQTGSSDPAEAVEADLLTFDLCEIKTEMLSGEHSDVDVPKLPPASTRCRRSVSGFVCVVCNKTFPYKSTLEGHLRTHMDQRPYQCEVCGKAFKRTCDLLIHSRFHDVEKRFECRDCGRRFRWKNGLDRHQRVHTGEKPFLCNRCGRTFADWGSHKQHMKWHSNLASTFRTERFPCKLCGKSFTWKRGLSRHTQQVHRWDTVSAATG